MFQKVALQGNALAEANQTSIRTKHAVAGHDKEKWITVARHAYSPCAPWRIHSPGHLSVGARLPPFDAAKFLPYAELEIRPSWG